MSNPADDNGHAEFVTFYELFLHLSYQLIGRAQLARAVAHHLKQRDVGSILDCAAGTGFPGLDLASSAYGPFSIHCCDADPAMLTVLCDHAEQLGLDTRPLVPPMPAERTPNDAPDGLVVGWAELDRITAEYDLVMCRGNSLAYANTWTGDDHVEPLERVGDYLGPMANRVRPGGYLLVDAPWVLSVGKTRSSTTLGGWSYEEEVDQGSDRREWRLKFLLNGVVELSFRRYSSLLTIRQLEEALIDLGFTETEPFRLEGERTNFGTIIARKPE